MHDVERAINLICLIQGFKRGDGFVAVKVKSMKSVLETCLSHEENTSMETRYNWIVVFKVFLNFFSKTAHKETFSLISPLERVYRCIGDLDLSIDSRSYL